MEEINIHLFDLAVYSMLLIGIVYMISGMYHDVRWRKRRLEWAISREPLHSLLTNLGVPLMRHVRQSDAEELSRQLYQCRDCAIHDTCVQAQQQHGAKVLLASCPNGAVLGSYLANR